MPGDTGTAEARVVHDLPRPFLRRFRQRLWLDRNVAHDTLRSRSARLREWGPWCRRDSSSEVPLSRRRRKPSVFSRIEGDWRQLESRSLTQLVSSAFDGLVWRSRVAGAQAVVWIITSRTSCWIRHSFADALEWIAEFKDPRVVMRVQRMLRLLCCLTDRFDE